jgi:starch phosphorylase
MEASGTGNMKFSMNGALTIGTLDGANVEIREEVGAENFFLFGLDAAEVQLRKTEGYSPHRIYDENGMLREALDFIVSGELTGGDRELFRPVVGNLLSHDPFMVLADYQDYIECQEQVNALWKDAGEWTKKSILNVARIGKFSSDRSIRDYCREIWQIRPGPDIKD